MTQATITEKKGYSCAPDGAVVVFFECGSTVTGKVAEWALRAGAAKQSFDPREETKVSKPLETKGKPKAKVNSRTRTKKGSS